MRRASPTRAATAISTGRPFDSARVQALGVARLQVLGLDAGGARLGAGRLEAGASAISSRCRHRLGRAGPAKSANRPLALRGVEIGVAGAHRQAVGLADDRQHLDPHREVEVADHAPDHGRLLGVLLAEVGDVGPDGVEELGDDGGDAAEVGARASVGARSTSASPPPHSTG